MLPMKLSFNQVSGIGYQVFCCLLLATCYLLPATCPAQAVSTETQTAEYWDKQGIIAENAKNYKEAVDNYTHALMLNDKYADAYFGRGIAAEKLGWTDGAMLDFDDAIKLNPIDADMYYNRGLLKFKLDKRDSVKTRFCIRLL